MPAYTLRPTYQLNAVVKITTKKQPSVSTNGSRDGSRPFHEMSHKNNCEQKQDEFGSFLGMMHDSYLDSMTYSFSSIQSMAAAKLKSSRHLHTVEYN